MDTMSTETVKANQWLYGLMLGKESFGRGGLVLFNFVLLYLLPQRSLETCLKGVWFSMQWVLAQAPACLQPLLPLFLAGLGPQPAICYPGGEANTPPTA
jgi:hypothetical protein